MDGQYPKGINVQRSASQSNPTEAKSADHLKFDNELIHLKYGGLQNSQGNVRESTIKCNSNSPQAVNPARKNVMKVNLYKYLVSVCQFSQN